jgi:cytochrome c-type biogenesis protein CcmE
MKTRHKKLILIVGGVSVLTVAGLLILNSFRNNLVFFFSPTEILEGKAPTSGTFRVGGLVEKGSLRKSSDGLKFDFTVTDLQKSINVHYEGILPDLFKEGQGVVAQGRLGNDRHFVADQVLAKHDENYMPPEVAKSLKRASGTTPANAPVSPSVQSAATTVPVAPLSENTGPTRATP